MAWQRRITTFTFVAILAAIGAWAGKTYRSVPLGEVCRYSFQCEEGAECVAERCETP
ncbi:MAG: EB domain-containing protein [Myxococcota bacterium]